MNHKMLRYFETRDGRCLPFQQIGKVGEFCIVLDCCTEILEMDQDCIFFVPDLFDTNDICNTSDRWRSQQPSPELYQDESEIERQAKDVLDLANIFRMDSFQVLGSGEVVNWLISNCSDRVEQVAASDSVRAIKDSGIALSN